MKLLAPVRLSEAGSLAKASTPEPFSTSKTSNWVARRGGLPDYVQHIAHDLMEKGGKTESEAIRLAIGIVKNPPAKWGPEAKAAAAKAAAEWEAKKGASSPKSTAKSVVKSVAESRRRPSSISLADRVTLRSQATARLKAIEETFGLQVMTKLTEAAAPPASWSPELKRTASGSSEIERHEVHDGGQHVGFLSTRKGYGPGNARPTRYSAKAVNGRMVGDTMDSKAQALDALKKHLEEAPARVSPHRGGRFLVANPDSYSGPTTMTEYPSESSARYAAGLPEQQTGVEKRSKVEDLSECVAFDVLTLDVLGEELAQFAPLRESGFSRVFDEAKHPRGAHGRFSVGDRVNYQHTMFGRVPARVTKVTSRHVVVKSSDERVSGTRSLTHKQAEEKLSITTKAPRTAQDEARQVAKKGVELKREGGAYAVHHDGKKVGAKMSLTDATRMVNRLRSKKPATPP